MVLARVGEDIVCRAGKAREVRKSRGGSKGIIEQWVGCVGAQVGEEEARYVLGAGRVPVAGLLLILCTALRNKVR